MYDIGDGCPMVPATIIADWVYAMMTGEFPKGGFKEHGARGWSSRDAELPYQGGSISNMISSVRKYYGRQFYGQLNPCDSWEVKHAATTANKKLGNGRRHAALALTDAIVVEMMRELDFNDLGWRRADVRVAEHWNEVGHTYE